MGDPPLVSVIVPTFNAARFIAATVDSALRQTLADLEVMVVDDGSSDDTVERVKRIGDGRIRLFEHAHRGAPAVMNAGIRAARGRYIGFLDHDDLWLPVKLERHVEYLERDRALAVTFSWTGLIDEHDRPINVHPAHWPGTLSFGQLLEDYVVGSYLVDRRAPLDGARGGMLRRAVSPVP